MANDNRSALQITLQNDLAKATGSRDSLTKWMEAYFQLEVTTRPSSQKEQRRDIELLISFVVSETGRDDVDHWTPRLSAAFKRMLSSTIKEDGLRRWNDRSVNRILAHVKTFANFIHKHRNFVLGNPMHKIKSIASATLLSIDRALTKTERRRIMDAADLLIKVGGISKDRHRYGKEEDRPKRKSYRPYRNRAIVYTLIETGMRRAAVTSINLSDVDFNRRTITALEKGGHSHEYVISREGLKAIEDYIQSERDVDTSDSGSDVLFLPACNTQNHSGRLHPNAINDIWNHVSKTAGVEGKTPHSARHSMGRHLIEKTGNVAAVQRQLGHKNAAYSMQYSRITNDELKSVLDSRD